MFQFYTDNGTFVGTSFNSVTAYPFFIGIVVSASKTAYGLFLCTKKSSSYTYYNGIEYGSATDTLLIYTASRHTTTVTITTSGLTVTKVNSSSTAGSTDGQYRAVYKEL